MFIRDVFKELCRTRLIYIILAVMIAVGADMAVQSIQVPMPSPADQVALPKPVPKPAPVVVQKPEPIPAPPLPQPPEIVEKPTGKAKIVIVIDDMGMARVHSREMIAMQAPLTLAFLPYADAVIDQMHAAQQAGHEVMLHMPMQPVGHEDPGPNAIMTSMTPADVQATLSTTLEKLPHIKGMNNHMGSAATADRIIMDAVMTVLANQKLFFLDSVTTQTSQAQAAALAHDVPYRARDLFLDHNPSQEAVTTALKSMEQIALRKGVAIAIGHPRPATIAALRQWLASYDRQRFEIVPLSTLFISAVAQPDHMSVPANAD